MTNLLIYIVRPEHRAWMYKEALAPEFPDINIRMADIPVSAEEAADWAEIVLTYGSLMADPIISRAGNLKWIHTLATGIDWVWKLTTLRDDVLITSTRGIHGPPMSEMAILMMMALARQFPRHFHNQNQRNWERIPGGLVDRKCAGILGVGVIAENLAPKLKALGMEVIGISSTVRSVPGIDRFRTREELLDVAPELDFLVVLIPHDLKTENIVNRSVLEAMKPSAFLINLARGGVVDETALIDALTKGSIAGAGLDVFKTEPLPSDHPLWGMENVIITPHNGGLCDVYVNYALPIFEENLRRYLAGDAGNMINLVAH